MNLRHYKDCQMIQGILHVTETSSEGIQNVAVNADFSVRGLKWIGLHAWISDFLKFLFVLIGVQISDKNVESEEIRWSLLVLIRYRLSHKIIAD